MGASLIFGCLLSLVLDGIACPRQTRGILWKFSWTHNSCSRTRWQTWLGKSLFNFLSLLVPFPALGASPLIHSGLDHLPYGLFQCALHRATLEEYPESAAGAECGHVSSFGHSKDYACNSVNYIGCQFASRSTSICWLSSLKPFMAWDQVTWGTILSRLYQLVPAKQRGLWTPLFKECWLVGLGRQPSLLLPPPYGISCPHSFLKEYDDLTLPTGMGIKKWHRMLGWLAAWGYSLFLLTCLFNSILISFLTLF